jgi:hypothetical protein
MSLLGPPLIQAASVLAPIETTSAMDPTGLGELAKADPAP